MKINYDGRKFRSIQNSSSGDVGPDTIFHYHQRGFRVWAEYSGGQIEIGSLIALCDAEGVLDIRYQHLNAEHHLRTGVCISTPKILIGGAIRLHEKWQWTSGDLSSGESVIEEVPS